MYEKHDEEYEIEQETEFQLDELESALPVDTDDILEIILNSRNHQSQDRHLPKEDVQSW